MFFHIRMTEGLESFVVRERGRPTGAATEPVKKWEPFVNVEEGCLVSDTGTVNVFDTWKSCENA